MNWGSMSSDKKEIERIGDFEEEWDKFFGKQHILNQIEIRTKNADKKINLLYRDLVCKKEDPDEQIFNHVTLGVVLNNAVFCYGLELDSHCIVELYGVLEYFIIKAIARLFLKIVPTKRLGELLKREGYLYKTDFLARKVRTGDLVVILKKIGILNKSDVTAFNNLETLRNSFVHKNLVKLAKDAKISNVPQFFEIDTPKVKIDAKKHFESTITILKKLYRHEDETRAEMSKFSRQRL